MQVKRPVRNSQAENYSPARQGSSSRQLLFETFCASQSFFGIKVSILHLHQQVRSPHKSIS